MIGILCILCVLFVSPVMAEEYVINYVLNGGTQATSGVPTVYNSGTAVTISGKPTRLNSTFNGWCKDENLTSCSAKQTIAKTDTGDKTFYAKWICNTGYRADEENQSCIANVYNVTFSCGDGNGTPPPNTSATYKSAFSPPLILKNSCIKPGYALAGWNIEGTNTNIAATTTWNWASDKTLTAIWAEFEHKFTVTTVDLDADATTINFNLKSGGKFWVDWGDGSIQTISRGVQHYNPTTTYSHTYELPGAYIVHFGGLATENPKGDGAYSISFSGQKWLAGISGSLCAIFPSGGGRQPHFINLFSGCSNLTGTIPNNLFSGCYGTTRRDMFSSVFKGTKLTGPIPEDLFAGITGLGTYGGFQYTFANCSLLDGTIPPKLFSRIKGCVTYAFYRVFYMTPRLTGYVPPELFSGIDKTCTGAFGYSFYGSGLLTKCPDGMAVYQTGFGLNGKVSCADCAYYNGECVPFCVFGTKLKTSNNLNFPLFARKVTTPAINVQQSPNTCYVPLEPGTASNSINISYDGETYHTAVAGLP
ncbi:MAG: InlB B-repeat-containing protein [Alphaproteobacteria bacterium]|nr:InlB B-repeat-containing protein [Alphaproteobacteria bacterium]